MCKAFVMWSGDVCYWKYPDISAFKKNRITFYAASFKLTFTARMRVWFTPKVSCEVISREEVPVREPEKMKPLSSTWAITTWSGHSSIRYESAPTPSLLHGGKKIHNKIKDVCWRHASVISYCAIKVIGQTCMLLHLSLTLLASQCQRQASVDVAWARLS